LNEVKSGNDLRPLNARPRISLTLHPGYGLNPGYGRYRLGHRRSRAEKRIALTGGALSCHVARP
jgi:hypothetical protein